MMKLLAVPMMSLGLLLFSLALCQTASARPSLGGGCTAAGCHGDNAGGNLAIDPDPLLLNVDDSGAVTFDVLSNPTTATIALYGLENTDLDVTSLGAGWTDAGTYAYFEPFFAGTATDPVLNLTIGPAAVEAPYGIGVTLAGGSGGGTSRWSSTYDFSVNVIPEPTTLVMLTVAGLGLCCLRRRRR